MPATAISGKERVLSYLKNWQGEKIETFRIAEDVELMDNTTTKWLCALRNEGHPVKSEKVPGKPYFRWWYDENKEASLLRRDPIGETAEERSKHDCPGCGADIFFSSVATKWAKSRCECGRVRK